jgi:hypothetical protein
LAVFLATLLVVAVPARADIGETIILRCTHNESLTGFSQSAYRQALKELTSTTEEYSPCGADIRRAQELAVRNPSGAGPSPAAAVPVNLSEQRAVADAAHTSPDALRLGAGSVRPGVVHVDIQSALRNVPASLISVLALQFAFLVLLIGRVFRNALRARRSR